MSLFFKYDGKARNNLFFTVSSESSLEKLQQFIQHLSLNFFLSLSFASKKLHPLAMRVTVTGLNSLTLVDAIVGGQRANLSDFLMTVCYFSRNSRWIEVGEVLCNRYFGFEYFH